MTRIVVVGGVAAGMSAASQAKRRQPEAEVIALERGPHVSYGACSMPYNIEDPGRSMDDLVVITAERFRSERGIDVRTRHEVLAIETDAKQLKVHDLDRQREYALTYDQLVIATGASAVRPPIEGIDRPGVFVLRELQHGQAIKRFLDEAKVTSAVIVGAGYIGMEMSEALTSRGVGVTVLEMTDQALFGWRPEIAALVAEELKAHQVTLETDVRVTRIEAQAAGSGRLRVESNRGVFEADMVLVSAGVRPNVTLAQAAGIALGPSGAIAVDDHMRTSAIDVFAAGDCAEAFHRVTGEASYIPLGDTANKQGKVAGANAAGGDQRFAGIVGTAAFKVFDLEVARTGLGAKEIEQYQLSAIAAVSRHSSFAHGYSNPQPITTVVYAELPGGRLLGAQMVGAAVVAKRIDIFAAALSAGMTVGDVEELDLAYAPPISPVYDPVLIAATVAKKEVVKAARA